MATAQLRPLSIGEILDAALKVVIKHWKPLSLSVIPAVLPLTIVAVLLEASMDVENAFNEFERTGDPADIPGEFWVSGGLSLVVTFIMSTIVTAVCFKGVADAWLGATPSVGRSWKFALPRVFGLLSMLLITFIAYVLGGVTCFIASIWLYVMWSVSTGALLFERVGPLTALTRSFELIKQRFWATFLLLIVVGLLTSFVGAIVQGIPSALVAIFAPDNEIAVGISDVIFGTLGSAIVLPISAAAMAILYFDQRVRKEGFDVQLLAEGIGGTFDPDAPIPAPLQSAGGYAPPPQGWQPQPPPGAWAPPQQQYGGGWSAPAHDAPPLRWGPASDAPPDTRPPEESPWMNPAPPPSGGSGGWVPPAGSAPTERLWGSGETPPRDDASRWSGDAVPPADDDAPPSLRKDAPPARDDDAPPSLRKDEPDEPRGPSGS